MEVTTHEQLAKLLDGINYDDMTKYVIKLARDNKLVIMSAIGDDTIRFDGFFYDEVDLFRGGKVFIGNDGVVYTKPGEGRKQIEVFWEQHRMYLWKFLTTIPHSKYSIKRDGKNWCQGIIFSMTNI